MTAEVLETPPVDASRWELWAGRILTTLAAIGILGLMVITIVDVSLRKASGSGLQWGIDATEVSLTVVAFLGMMPAALSSSHVSTPILIDAVPERVGRALRGAGLVFTVSFLAWMTKLTTVYAHDSFELKERHIGISGVVLWPGKMAVAIGTAALAITYLMRLIRLLRDEKLARAERRGRASKASE